MERWDYKKKEDCELKHVDLFLNEVIEVCRNHGFSIGHQDSHGAFEVHETVDDDYYEWLKNAHYYPPDEASY